MNIHTERQCYFDNTPDAVSYRSVPGGSSVCVLTVTCAPPHVKDAAILDLSLYMYTFRKSTTWILAWNFNIHIDMTWHSMMTHTCHLGIVTKYAYTRNNGRDCNTRTVRTDFPISNILRATRWLAGRKGHKGHRIMDLNRSNSGLPCNYQIGLTCDNWF